MADNTVKNRYAALRESTRVSSALNEDKHEEEYASKIRSYYDNLQKQKRNEQLKAQGKSDDDIKIIDTLENIRKEKAQKTAAYEQSKPVSGFTTDKAVEVGKVLSGNAPATSKIFDTTGLKMLAEKRAEQQKTDTETSDTLKYLFGKNTPAGERLIEDVVKTADKVVPEPVQYAARRGTLGTVSSLASMADTAEAVRKGIENAQSGGSFKSGFANYLKNDANNQAYVEQQKEKVEAKRQDKPNVVTNVLGDLSESFGYMIPSLAASVVSGAAGIPAAISKVVSATPLATSGFASSTREALKNGATENEALAYGALSALIESAGEYAIGGVLGKGGGLIDTGLKKLGLDLSKKVSNPIVKSLVNYGTSALGEGAEEVIQEALSVGARRLTYDENARINAGELAYAGLLGSLMGGIGSLPSLISNTVSGARTVKDFKTIADNISSIAENGGINDAKTLADGMRTAWNGQIQAIEANKTYDSEQKELAAAPYKWMVQELDKLTKTLESPELKDAVRSNPATAEAVKGGELTKAEALEKNKNITDDIRNDSTLTTEEKKSYIDPIMSESAKINAMDDVRPDSGEFDDAEGIREAMEEIAAEESAEAQTAPEEPKAETVKSEAETVEPVTEEQPLTESTESGTIKAVEAPEAVQQPESQPVTEVSEAPEAVNEVALPEDEFKEVMEFMERTSSETASEVPESEQNVPEAEETSAESRFKNDTLDVTTKKHTKTGADLIVGKVSRTLPTEEYAEFLKAVKAAGGYYSKYAGGFVFPNEESLDKMRDFVDVNDMRTVSDTSATVQETAVEQEAQTAESEVAEPAAEAPQEAQRVQETTEETAVTESAAEKETVAEQPQEAVQGGTEEVPEAKQETEQPVKEPKNLKGPETLSKNAQKISDKIDGGASADELKLADGKKYGFDLEQREYIADALVNGLNTDAEEIHVEVPRDGTLDINNNTGSVATVLDKLGASVPEIELTTTQKNALRYMASKDRLIYGSVGDNIFITDGIVGTVLPKDAADSFIKENIRKAEANARAAEIYKNVSNAEKISLERTAGYVNVPGMGVCVEISDTNGDKYVLTESRLNVLNVKKSTELAIAGINRGVSTVVAMENGEVVALAVARPESTIRDEIVRTATGSGKTEKVGLPYKKGYFDGTSAPTETSDTTKKEASQLTDVQSLGVTPKNGSETTSDNIISQDTENVKSESKSAASQVAGFVADKLAKGKPITRNELNAYAEEVYGKKLADGGIDIKDINDAMELGMNRHILSLKGDYDVDSLLKLTGLLPTQTNRTEDQIKLQQFSTPPAIAYTAAYAANIGENDVVLEPSAGIGGIAVFAKNDGAKVHVNELDERRLSIIKELPFDGFYNERGEQLHNILGDKFSPTVVVMNPPFSSSAVRNAKDIHEAAKHIESALKLLREGGRLVAITGRGMNMEAPAFRKWWDDIKSEYNVRANIGLDGKNYTKYGTSFDIQLIVIDKNGPTTEDVLKGKVDNVNELYNMIGEIRNERTAAEPVRPVSGTESDDVRRMVGEEAENKARNNRGTEQKAVESTPNTADKGSVSEVSDTERSAGTSTDTGRSSRKEYAESRGRTVGRNESSDGRNLNEDRRQRSVPATDGESVDGRRDGGMGVLRGTNGELRGSDERDSEQSGEDDIVKRTVKQPKTELTEDKYEEYVPQTLTVKGAKKHPTKLVESAAMATVKAPEMTEALHLPKKLVTDGILSDAQLEAVTRAWQSFGKTLDNGETQGYFIGDGTGVGKGREIAGIMYESFLRGQDKAVWITKGSNLLTDAKRDLSAVIEGETPILQLEGGKKLAKLDKFNKGVLFATYDTVGKERTKKDSNLNGLVNWLGKDFDGVIAFDEAHQMGNATGAKTSRGRSKPAEKAVACIELQRMLPKAKIVYVSATGATEVTNLAYAERLGLWGMGTPFPSQEAFVSKIDAGGVAAMEVVARTLKARGKYIARSLSFEGVSYRRLTHNLDDSQSETYDIAAKSWQVVIQNFNKALEVTGGNLNSKAKSNAAQRIWNCEQQFFEQLTTSMMTPALIEDARKQLEAGKSVVVQLTRTNEAQAERETASAKKNEDGTLDLNETDFSCKGILEELVKNCFPVQEYEVVYDESGNKTSKPVEDSNKKPVLNAEAVKMRDALLAQIGQLTLPDAPIDMIYRGLGDDVVTENTGRKKRFGLDENGNTVIIKLPANKDSFVRDFQDGRKRVMIFSEAGGTGKSYHADKNAKNQQQRIHYLLQPGWKANAAVQGFGRTLRSNQASAPEYVLMTTNVPAQARFISTIARRLDQLGALTKGQSNTGSQGIFNSSDNLEGEYARMSLRTLLSTLDRETLHEMGYDNLYNKQNQLNTSSEHLTNINRFLNRLFVLPLDKQPEVYGRFVSEMENRIQIAKDSGKYSDGVENYKAKRVEVNSKTAADIDSDYGTEVDYYVLDAYDDVVFNKFKDIKTKNERFTGFYKTPRGKVRAVFSAGTIVDDKTLNKVNAYSTVSVAGRPVRLMQGDISAWTKIDASEAETLWKEETAEHPKEAKTELHVVAGDLLQVWNQLPDTNISFKRILLNDGETIIGRVIPKKELESTLRALNLDGKKRAYTAADAVKALNDGGFVQMAGGMRIERKRVANEYRYEFSGRIAPWQMTTIKNQYGLFSEVIQYVNRYFIPTDKAESIIEKLSKSYPIQEVYSAKEADAEYSLAHDGIMSDDEYVQELIDNVISPMGIKVAFDKADTETDSAEYSIDTITDNNNVSYGVGVKLDSVLLDKLSPEERIKAVKERIKSIGGQSFVAYDSNKNASNIIIAESNRKFINKSGKKVPVNKDMTSYLDNTVKQESLVLVDELITTSLYKGSEPARHPHGWLDNDGKNSWEVWETYVQDKNNTVWKATLRVANSTNGEKILYDIFPIEKAAGVRTSDTATANPIIPQKPNLSSGTNKKSNIPAADKAASGSLPDGTLPETIIPQKFNLSSTSDKTISPLAYYDSETRTIHVVGNPPSLTTLLGHELYHALSKEDQARLAYFFRTNSDTNSAEFKAWKQEITELYSKKYAETGREFTEADFWREYAAMSCESLFTDKQFIERLCGKSKTLGQRILDWIKNAWYAITGKSRYTTNRAVEAGKLTEQALRKAALMYSDALGVKLNLVERQIVKSSVPEAIASDIGFGDDVGGINYSLEPAADITDTPAENTGNVTMEQFNEDFESAKVVPKSDSWYTKGKNALGEMFAKLTRADSLIPESGADGVYYTPLRRQIIGIRDNFVRSQNSALTRIMDMMTYTDEKGKRKALSKEEANKFTRLVYLSDLAETAKIQRERGEEVRLPKNYSEEDVHRLYEELNNELTESERTHINEALEKRAAAWKQLTDDYIKYNRMCGFDVSNRISRQAYYRHQVIDFMTDPQGHEKRYGKVNGMHLNDGRSFLKRRTGSERDINTDFASVEFLSLQQMFFDTEVAKALAKIKTKYDMKPEFVKRAKAENQEAIDNLILREAREAMAADMRAKGQTVKDEDIDSLEPLTTVKNGKMRYVSDTYEQIMQYNRGMARSLSQLTQLALEGELDGYAHTSGHRLALEQLKRGMMNETVFDFMSEFVSENDNEAAIAARVFFKNSALKRQFVEDTLGDKYMTWEKIAKDEGYVIFQPREGRYSYNTNALDESAAKKLAEQIAATVAKDEAVNLTTEEWNAIISTYAKQIRVMGQPYEQWAVKPLVTQVLNKNAMEAIAGQVNSNSAVNIYLKALRNWKGWVTAGNPLRALKYHIRNAIGDLEAALTADPGIMRTVPKAYTEIRDMLRSGKETETYREWLELGGDTNLIGIQEMTETERRKYLPMFAEDLSTSKKVIAAVTKPFDTLSKYGEDANRARESLLRYASYLYYKEKLTKSGGKVTDYVASNRNIINGLDTIEEKAYQLSADALGNYADISEFGRQIRRGLIPFYSFTESNMRRYYRFFANPIISIAKGDNRAQNVGNFAKRMATPAVSALILALINGVLNREADEKLPEDVRNRPHITFGEWGGNVYAFTRIGNIPELLEWVGLDDWKWTEDDWQAPIDKLWDSITPAIKVPFELATGESRYSDFDQPSAIRDRWEYLFNTFGLSDVYKGVTGKPVKNGLWDTIQNMVIYKYDTMESAYWDTIANKRNWQNQAQTSVDPTPKSNALYYMKQAIRYGEADKAKKYMKEYFKQGGTGKGIVTSINTMNPYYGFTSDDNKAKGDEWVASLDAVEREKLESAVSYYNSYLAIPEAYKKKLNKADNATAEALMNTYIDYVIGAQKAAGRK